MSESNKIALEIISLLVDKKLPFALSVLKDAEMIIRNTATVSTDGADEYLNLPLVPYLGEK